MGRGFLVLANLVVSKNLLELLFRNAHPNTVGAVHHEYDRMDITVKKVSLKGDLPREQGAFSKDRSHWLLLGRQLACRH